MDISLNRKSRTQSFWLGDQWTQTPLVSGTQLIEACSVAGKQSGLCSGGKTVSKGAFIGGKQSAKARLEAGKQSAKVRLEAGKQSAKARLEAGKQ